jgi:esterase
MKLFYREIGNGEPIVLIHGLFGSSDNLLGPGKVLAEDYKIYLIDQRNHGSSPHSETHTYEAMADDLEEFLDSKNLKNPLIVGHSMGGKTVMKFAANNPDFEARYIVMDISPRFYNRHHDQILDGLNSLKIEDIESRQDADKQLSEYVPELGVRQFLLKNLERTESGFQWKVNLKVLTDQIDNIGEGLDEDIRIDKSFLFIKGNNSNYIRAHDEELIRKQFSHVDIKGLDGAGHWLHAEKPKEFVDLVKSFMKSSE